MAIDNLSLSPVRLGAPTTGTAAPAVNNAPAPSIGSDSLSLSSPASLLANANGVAATNTVKTAAITTADSGSYTVKPGDTLSGIAKDQLGDASRWEEIYEGNQDQIDDPNLIYPGQTFTLPGAKPAEAPIDLQPIDLTPEPAATKPAPAPKPLPKPIPRDFPPYGPTHCFPHHPPVRPTFPQQPSNRTEILKQKLELLKMEQQVVQLELQLDRMLGKLDAPRPTSRFGGALN